MASFANKTAALGYQVRFSYDYSDVLVSAEMENINDPDTKTLYSATAPKRYYQGSGANIRQLDEDSNTVYASPGVGFYASLSGTVSDGLYLYQCEKLDAATAINVDDRSSSTYDPITYTTNWLKNSSCYDGAGGLSVVQAF